MKNGVLVLVLGLMTVFAASAAGKKISDPKCQKFCQLKERCSSLAPQCPLHARCKCNA